MSLPNSSPLIQFGPRSCKIHYEFPIYQPENFDAYREDARRVIRVLKGEPEGDDLEILPELGLNAVGLDVFMAAMAYELLNS